MPAGKGQKSASFGDFLLKVALATSFSDIDKPSFEKEYGKRIVSSSVAETGFSRQLQIVTSTRSLSGLVDKFATNYSHSISSRIPTYPYSPLDLILLA
ncbi:hypothetical protein F5880DRAFT_1619012 [Lentinula raphanica]|nr:hypothetical protein F5880DRAFT_1619012 [Lentinula raphanica]